MTTRTRAALVALAVAVLVVAIVVSASSDSKKTETQTASSAPPPRVPVVTVRGANPVGGIQKLKFNQGDRARFAIVSDVADEIHVHGYDLMRDVKAGGRVAFDFKADKDGIFEIELEGRKRQIASLQVAP